MFDTMKRALTAIATVVGMCACANSAVPFPSPDTELNDVDPRIPLGRYVQYEASNTVVNTVVLTNGVITVGDSSVNVSFTSSNTQLVSTIQAVAPAPGNYSAVSNRAMSAIQSLEPSTNYTDSATNAVYQLGSPYLVPWDSNHAHPPVEEAMTYDGYKEVGDGFLMYLGITGYSTWYFPDVVEVTNIARTASMSVVAPAAAAATNYTDSVASEFETGGRSVESAAYSSIAGGLYDDDGMDVYSATALLVASTNAAVAETSAFSNNVYKTLSSLRYDMITDGTNTLSANLDYEYEKVLTNTWVVNGIPYTTTTGYTECSYFPPNPNEEDMGYTLTLNEGSSWESGYYDLSIGAWFWRNQGTEEDPDYQWVVDSGGTTGLLPANGTSFNIDGFVGTYPIKRMETSKVALTNDIPVVPSNILLTNAQGTATISGSLLVGTNNDVTVGDVLGEPLPNIAIGSQNVSTGTLSFAWGNMNVSDKPSSMALGVNAMATNNLALVWNIILDREYGSHGDGTFNINPLGGIRGFWVGETNMADHIDAIASKYGTDVVGPTTNAVVGTAADARATGTALYTGFTEWKFSGLPSGSSPFVLEYNSVAEEAAPIGWYGSFGFGGTDYFTYSSSGADATSLTMPSDPSGYTITATRHLVTPTKTSQLTNNGTNGVPFALTTDIPPVVSPSTNAVAGTAAEAKATGIALYTGYTTWEPYGENPGYKLISVEYNSGSWKVVYIVDGDSNVYTNTTSGAGDETDLTFHSELNSITRHLVTPTKTSQLINDSSFVTTNNSGTIETSIGIYGSLKNGTNVVATGIFSHAEGGSTTAEGSYSHSEGNGTFARGLASHSEGLFTRATERASHSSGACALATNSWSFVWSGLERSPYYGSHGVSSFNVNPINGINGFYIGEQTLQQAIVASIMDTSLSNDIEVVYQNQDNSDAAMISDIVVTQAVTNHVPTIRTAVRDVVDNAIGNGMVNVTNHYSDWFFTGLPSGVTVTSLQYRNNQWAIHLSNGDHQSMNGNGENSTSLLFLSSEWMEGTGTGDVTADRFFQLQDRSMNILTTWGLTVPLSFPKPVPNKFREFRLRLVITAQPSSADYLNLHGAITNGVEETISFETDDGTFPSVTTISTNLYHFVETAPSIFYVEKKQLTPAPLF